MTENYHRFASSKTGIPGGQPQLYLSFNDPPEVPSLEVPVNGSMPIA